MTRETLQNSLAAHEEWERKAEELAVRLICRPKKTACPKLTRVRSIIMVADWDPEKWDPWDVVTSEESEREEEES